MTDDKDQKIPAGNWDQFIPCTKPVYLGNGIWYRPHKHWGMNVWAGEGLFEKKYGENSDRSGCLWDIDIMGRPINKEDNYVGHLGACARPIVVFQRIYWKGDKSISAVLSYPNGLSITDKYFWEIYPIAGDCDRFYGDNAEQEMEEKIKEELNA